MRTTIKDIAAKTGLSVTTVSLVLNGKSKKIPKSTQDFVLKTAKELSYRPNQLAVSLLTKRTNTLGLIVSDISNNFFSTLAKGVEDQCRRSGWNIILCNTGDEHRHDLECISILADKGVDGILYCMSIDADLGKLRKSIALMEQLSMPFIMMDRSSSEISCHVVKLNHKMGGYLATEHLISLGHRRIACVTAPCSLEDSANRLEGYLHALEEAGIPFDPEILIEGDYTTESGFNAMLELNRKGKDFTAVFAFNDMMAYGVYKAIKSLGLVMPDDLSVVGYDDIFFSEIMEVPLTTISQPTYAMGEEAARRMIQVIDGSPVSEKIKIFEPALIVRKSTGSI